MTTATSNTPKQARGHDDDRPGIWVGYGKLVRLFRDNAGLTQDELAERIGYSGEQVSSVEQGRRPAKTPFTQAAEQVLNAGGALQALQDDVDLAKLPPSSATSPSSNSTPSAATPTTRSSSPGSYRPRTTHGHCSKGTAHP